MRVNGITPIMRLTMYIKIPFQPLAASLTAEMIYVLVNESVLKLSYFFRICENVLTQ